MEDEREEMRALLALSMCKGVSGGTIFSLVEHFGSARVALSAAADDLMGVDGVGPAVAQAIGRRPDDAAVEREIDLMRRFRTRLIPYTSDDYPRQLKHLDRGAPVLLRMRGEYRQRDAAAVAVVGARRCSTYGRQQAGRIASDLASMGFTVVSGMADGIDSAAHRGALLAGGRTVAVLGSGVGHALQGPDAELALEIAAAGAVLSELPMEAPPRPGNFPPRNRIISGVSLGVVVVEAAARSGSLITARLAGEQGRVVCAVPGSVDSPTSHGCHQLIRDGAVLVENARDVADALGPLAEPIAVPAAGRGEEAHVVADARELALNERERAMLELVTGNPRHIDELIAETGLAVSIVSSTLLTLEIRGLVRQISGQRYVRA